MQLIFYLACFILLICLPSILITTLLYFLSKKFNFQYTTTGFLKYEKIMFYYDSEYFFLNLKLDCFHIYLIWLRVRVLFRGIIVTYVIKTKSLSFIKAKAVNKADFVQTYVLKRNEGSNLYNDHNDYLNNIKNKFYQIINDKYIFKHINEKKEWKSEEETIDNILKKSEIGRKDIFLRNLITFFDFLCENVEVNFKLSEMEVYHKLSLRKLIIGAVKGIHKNKEIHFVCFIYDLKIKEYVIYQNPADSVSNINILGNSNFNSKSQKSIEFIILENKILFFNLKLESGLNPKNLCHSLINTFNFKSEISHTKIELSTRVLKNIFKICNQIIKLEKIKEKNSNLLDKGISNSPLDIESDDVKYLNGNIFTNRNPEVRTVIECVEEIILAKITSQFKKMKIKLNMTEIKIVSDNHQYIYTHLNFSNLSLHSKNDLNYYFDSSKIKLAKSWIDIKIQDLVMSSYKKEKIILDLQNYTLNMSEDIIYYHQQKEGSIRTIVNSETPQMDVVMSTKELDKIIELIICIVVGLEKLEEVNERTSYLHKYIEKYAKQSFLILNFEKVNLTVYDDKIQADLFNACVNVRVEEEKFSGSKVDILFPPLSMNVFSKNSTKYSSNLTLKGFKLNIVDDIKSSRIDIVFEDTLLLVYDNHLIDALKFIADFLTNCLRGGVKKTHKKKRKIPAVKKKDSNVMPYSADAGGLSKKKEIVSIFFKKVNLFNYVDFDDIITIKLSDFEYIVNDWMLIPKIKIYHQSTVKQFIKKRTLFIKLERFSIKFQPEINEINIDFGDIILNAYCFELAFVIAKISIYHSFFPVWIVYHMAYKHNIDEDYRKIYVSDFTKKDRCHIKFGNILVKINQYLISSASILKTNPEIMKTEMEKCTSNGTSNPLGTNSPHSYYGNEIKYLKSLNRDQISIKVTNFVIITWGHKEKETANDMRLSRDEDDIEYISYYKRIIRKGEVQLNFETIDMYQENSKLIELFNFRILMQDVFTFDDFELNKFNSIVYNYRIHEIFYKEVKSKKTKVASVEIFIENLKVNLEDILIIDKLSLFYMQAVKSVLSLPFNDYAIVEIMDNQESNVSTSLNIYVKNFETVVNSIDPVSNLIYNRLYLKIDLLSLFIEENLNVNKMEISVFYLTFGFDFSQNFDYPLIIIPVIELNIDNINNTIRLNVPNKQIKKLNVDLNLNAKNSNNPMILNDNLYVSQLDMFIMETKSFTLFLNFNYLNTFYKIFENFWKRSDFVKKYLFGNSGKENSKKNYGHGHIKNGELSHNLKFRSPSQIKNKLNNAHPGAIASAFENKDIFPKPSKQNQLKLLLTMFDMKIIYLVQYKNEYNTIFKFHSEIKDKGYFGYIIRFYSISLKYLVDSDNVKRDELKLNTNLFTVSFLHEENFNDEKYFVFDKEIKFSRFTNLKLLKNFNHFMELPYTNKYKLINNNFFKFFYIEDREEELKENFKNVNVGNTNTNPDPNPNNITIAKAAGNTLQPTLTLSKRNKMKTSSPYVDLIFDNKHTLMKIFDISFKRDKVNINNTEDIYFIVNDIKLTWNKFNMDVFNILLFQDVLLIVDKIILKINKGEKSKSNEDEVIVFDFGRFNFVFELTEPQICIQNEIKNSKVLLTTKSNCSAKISKICVNEDSKDFKLELQLTAMSLYIAPNYMDSNAIYWIGESDENTYYLEENLFNRMLETPNIKFTIFENIRNNLITHKADPYTNLAITVDKITGDFGHSYFNHFMNVIEVFLFDRGYTYAEQKQNIDSRTKDLELFRLEEIKNRIKLNTFSFISNNKTKQKEITFTLKDVVLTLLKENKEIIKLMMKNFEGEHIIYTDKASDTNINVKNLKILDLFENKNDTILTPNFEIQNIGEFEDKIDLITFRRKDSYVSIGTDSKWYVLDYFEFNILPLLINTSKYHCDFIIEFFFDNSGKINDKSEEEYRDIIVGGGKNKKNVLVESQRELELKTNTNNNTAGIEISYPVYFKHVRINETQLAISFFLADHSPFNLRNAKLKFSAFEKKDKFYTNNTLLSRFIGHLKFISFTNASNILASLFNWGETEVRPQKKKKNDEEALRKMVLGNQFNK